MPGKLTCEEIVDDAIRRCNNRFTMADITELDKYRRIKVFIYVHNAVLKHKLIEERDLDGNRYYSRPGKVAKREEA